MLRKLFAAIKKLFSAAPLNEIKTGRLACYTLSTADHGETRIVAIPEVFKTGQKRLREGVKYRFVNAWMASTAPNIISETEDSHALQVGDRIVVDPRDDLPIKIGGNAGLVLETTVGEDLGGHTVYVVYLHKPGVLKLKVRGKPRTKIKIPVVYPDIPDRASKLLGPLQPQLAIPDSEIRHPLDRWIAAVDLVSNSGCNFFSACPISPWNDLDVGVPFPTVGRTYNLTKIDPTYRKVMTCMFWRAARAGITIHWYPFDHVSLTHRWMWDRHPLNAANNIHGWITEEPCSCGYSKDWAHNVTHKYEAAFKGSCQGPEIAALVAGIHRNLAGLIPAELRGRHVVGDMIEGEGRTDSWKKHCEILGHNWKKASNLKAWYHDSDWGSGMGQLPQVLDFDPRWRQLAAATDVVVCHGCDSGGATDHRLRRLDVHAMRFGFRVMASTDGVGLGSTKRRPEGKRPSADDIVDAWTEGRRAVGDDRFAGMEIKLLGWEDANEILPAVAKQIPGI